MRLLTLYIHRLLWYIVVFRDMAGLERPHDTPSGIDKDLEGRPRARKTISGFDIQSALMATPQTPFLDKRQDHRATDLTTEELLKARSHSCIAEFAS